MPTCDNCGRNSNLMLVVQHDDQSLNKYCPEYGCMEIAKNKMMALKYEKIQMVGGKK